LTSVIEIVYYRDKKYRKERGGKKMDEDIKKRIGELVCDVLKERPRLSFLDKKRHQMKIAWQVLKELDRKGILVEDIGPLISQAWEQIERPVCPVEGQREGKKSVTV
jgi:hypothetical protein